MVKSWMVLQTQIWFKTLRQMLPSSNFLMFQKKNRGNISKRQRLLGFPLTAKQKCAGSSSIFIFSPGAVLSPCPSNGTQPCSSAPHPKVYTLRTFISSFFYHLNGCIILNYFNLPPSFIACASSSDFLRQKG